MQVQYGQELLTKWSDGTRLQAALAPLFQPPEEEMVPLATTIAVAVVRKSQLAAAREAARSVILDEHREECREQAELSRDGLYFMSWAAPGTGDQAWCEIGGSCDGRSRNNTTDSWHGNILDPLPRCDWIQRKAALPCCCLCVCSPPGVCPSFLC